MGLFSRRSKDPVQGTAYVAAATVAPSGTSSASCRMQLSVPVPGEPSVAVEKTAMVSTKHWPYAGMSLPIEAERGTRPASENLVGMDLDGDGVVGTSTTPGSGSPTLDNDVAKAFTAFFAAANARAVVPGDHDRISALERLVALRDSGGLSPEEFEVEKKRILGSG